MKEIKGIGVSPGISIGKARWLNKMKGVATGVLLQNEEGILEATILFETAIRLSVEEIEALLEERNASLSEEEMAILEIQVELITDPQLNDDVLALIRVDKKNANDALLEVIASLVKLFESMEDEYMRARSADMKDAGDRIWKNLHKHQTSLQNYEPGTIIIAQELAPSDTIGMDLRYIAGFATLLGSSTAHTAIIARAKGMPAVVGCGIALNDVKDGALLILDGKAGEVYCNPDNEIIEIFREKQARFIRLNEELKQLKNVPAITTDGTKITLLANIGGVDDLEAINDNGGEGVGLFRTELLFMERASFPSEDEQFELYKQVALRSKGRPLIIRTMDLGGDKDLPYFDLPVEQNPFLGYRAIRICLDRPDVFLAQLKAILRASVFGDVRIMFPMISGAQELRAAKSALEDAKRLLAGSGIPFNAQIKTGIMIEVPSAAITADILAKEADFFSIGTNDLCQYTLAVDRMNSKISYLYDPFDPAVLRLIGFVLDQAAKHGIPAGMCGELAGDPLATKLLLGMGLRDFSMSAAAIPAIKKIIISASSEEAKRVYETVKQMDNSETIKAYLKGL